MTLHPQFPTSPYAPLILEQRWFPARRALRITACEKSLPPLVAKICRKVQTWRDNGYPGASATSVSVLRQNRAMDPASAIRTYPKSSRHVIAVKVSAFRGNDTMSFVPVTVACPV